MRSGFARRGFLIAITAVLISCGGGSNDDSCGGSGPLFVSDTYRYSGATLQVGKDFTQAPSNAPVICKANYSATALPDGLTIDASNGVISGRPTREQTSQVRITLTSGGYTGSIVRTGSFQVRPYPLAPNGWNFMNRASPLPSAEENVASTIGSTIYAITPTNQNNGRLQFGVAKSVNDGAGWTAMPTASISTNLSSGQPFEALRSTSDGQFIYIIAYEPSLTAMSPATLITRRFDGITWTTIQAIQSPPRRVDFSVTADGNALYIVGGIPTDFGIVLPTGANTYSYSNQVWRSLDQGANWVLMSPNTTLPARAGHCAAYGGGQFYIYGGYDNTNQRNDLWKSPDAINWTLVGNSGSHPPRPRTTTPNWREVCTIKGGQFHVVFDSSSWRGLTSTAQTGHMDLVSDIWSDDGPLPISDLADSRRYHPGLLSHANKLYIVGGGCGYTSCSIGRDDVWSK